MPENTAVTAATPKDGPLSVDRLIACLDQYTFEDYLQERCSLSETRMGEMLFNTARRQLKEKFTQLKTLTVEIQALEELLLLN